jgi:hypothetical protein
MTLNGTARDRGCMKGGKGRVKRVQVSLATRKSAGGNAHCRFAKPGGGFTAPRPCGQRLWMNVSGHESWTFKYRHSLPPAHYTLRSRALDAAGHLTPRTHRATFHFVVG